MGFWGFKPFENDYALDDYGGYNKTKSLIGKFWQGIKRGADASVDVNEICGAILRSFHLYDGILNTDTEIELVTAIANRKFTEATHEAMYESSIMMLCVATIDLEEREKMLSYAVNKFKAIIEANNFQPEFDKNELWIDTDLNEENSDYQQIYNLARQTVNCNFENVETPMALTEENVKWLINEQDKFDAAIGIKRYTEAYPEGALIINMILGRNEKMKLMFNIKTKAISTLYGSGLGWGLTTETMGYKTLPTNEWLHKYFPKGFYIVKLSDRYTDILGLYSIDYNMLLQDCDINSTRDFVVKTSFIKEVAKYVPVYKNRQQYEQNRKLKKEEAKPGIKVKCTNKFYNKNKIVAYEIMDLQGKKMTVNPEALKDAIRKQQINCVNLTLTSDNRLMSKEN